MKRTLVACSLLSTLCYAQAPRPKTLLLLVEGTTKSVRLTAAWQKGFPFQELRAHTAAATGWVRVLDAQRHVLARVRLDLSTINRDPGTAGRARLIGDDRILEPNVSVLVKVPDFRDARGHSLIAALEFDIVDAGRARRFGSASAGELRRVLSATASEPNSAITVKTHLNSGPVGNRYDIVILAEGYRASELAKFHADVTRWMNNLFGREPFKRYKRFFNVHSVHNPSVDSGADHPDRNPPLVRNTVYNASYNTGNTPRCLYIRNYSIARRDAARAPDVEGRIVVFVNDSRYGGCAGSFAVSYNGSVGPEVQTHEFGHSYGGLADEYSYGRSGTYGGGEPRAANITASSACSKWALWRGTNGIGCFEGAGYYRKGLWRPKANCLMRALNVPLCEICVEEMTKDGYDTVNPIENVRPRGPITLSKPAQRNVSFVNLVPSGAQIRWFVDNAQRQNGGTSFQLRSSSLTAGSHVLKVEVKDRTALVRKDATNRLTRTYSWPLIIRDPNLPDLDLHALTLPSSTTSGATISVQNFVRNLGNSAASSFAVENFVGANSTVTVNDIYLGSTTVRSLGATASIRVTRRCAIPSWVDTGSYYLAGWVDRANAISELSEANNKRTGRLQIRATSACRANLEHQNTLQYPANSASLSLSAGGTSNLILTAPCNKGHWYLAQWTCSGTSPGIRLPSGHVLPINFDACTSLGLSLVNGPVFQSFFGRIDPRTGHAYPTVSLPRLTIAPFSSHFAAWFMAPDFSRVTGTTTALSHAFTR